MSHRKVELIIVAIVSCFKHPEYDLIVLRLHSNFAINILNSVVIPISQVEHPFNKSALDRVMIHLKATTALSPHFVHASVTLGELLDVYRIIHADCLECNVSICLSATLRRHVRTNFFLQNWVLVLVRASIFGIDDFNASHRILAALVISRLL